MTTATRASMGVIREHADLLSMMDAALEEAMAVGRARGIAFPDGLVEGTKEMVRNFPPESKSSMLEDLERGRRLELPWLSGAVARMGRGNRRPDADARLYQRDPAASPGWAIGINTKHTKVRRTLLPSETFAFFVTFVFSRFFAVTQG